MATKYQIVPIATGPLKVEKIMYRLISINPRRVLGRPFTAWTYHRLMEIHGAYIVADALSKYNYYDWEDLKLLEVLSGE